MIYLSFQALVWCSKETASETEENDSANTEMHVDKDWKWVQDHIFQDTENPDHRQYVVKKII